MTSVPTVELNNGQQIPQLGFGVFQIEPEDTAKAVRQAIEIGYRHIDTAEMYGNEAEVAQGIADSGVDRADIWITSKLNNGFHRPDDARKAFEESLSKLRSDYVDLFLIHWPLPTRYDGDYVSTWQALIDFAKQGRAKSVGVSNFQVPHLQRLAQETDLVPAANQVEVHPYLIQESVRAYGTDHNIATEAWSPIAQGGVLKDPVITKIADGLGKTAAQVTLRWHIERGDIVFPKSVTPSRIQENFDIFDFELADAEVDAISALDKGEDGRTGPNPDEFDMIPS